MEHGTTCERCGTPLLPGKSFCHQCGHRAQLRCPQCDELLQASYRFCPACGASVGGEPATGTPDVTAQHDGMADNLALAATFERLSGTMPAPLAAKVLSTRGRIEGERKQVTILFCDLVASASIAERMDPEDYRDLLDRYLSVVFEQVHRFEGIVNQIAGDGVMALFGAPIAHEDAPERACHAALAIRDGVAALSNTLRNERHVTIEIRIGINTGPVIVGTVGNDLKMDYTAIGDTTNLASRLQALTRPNTIVISGATHRLARQGFTFRSLGELTVRGKALPVTAYEVVGPALPPARAREASLSPFIGRRDERRQLEEAFQQASRGVGHVVDIVGEVGVGKSRLLHEFTEQQGGNGARMLHGECFSYTQGVPYDPFVRMLRRHLTIEPGDSHELACQRLAARVEPWDPELAVAFPVLCRMLGLATPVGADALGSELQWAAFDAVARLILAEADHGPVIVTLEDIQWMDSASIELLMSLVNRLHSSRVLIVCTSRPEYDSPWRHRQNATQIILAPLSPAESVQIITAMLGGPPPAGLVDAVIARAEGNPLFTEEITRGLLEDGIVLRTERGPVLTRQLEHLDVPATIQEILAARLDRLPPAAKRVVQVASVIGREFRTDLLQELLTEDDINVAAQLLALEQNEVIYSKDALTNDEYLFRHALTQEVAYQGLLVRQRRQLHEAIGFALERRRHGPPGPDEVSAVLALHFRLGENHSKAMEYLLHAAAHAEAAPSYASAADLYGQAWTLSQPALANDDSARQALVAGLGMLQLLAVFGEGPAGSIKTLSADVSRLIDRVGTASDRIAAAAYTGLLQMMGAAEQFESGLAALEHALRLAEHEDSQVWRWRILRSLAIAYVFDGRFDEAAVLTDAVRDEIVTAGEERTGPDMFLSARMLCDVVSIYRDDFEQVLIEADRTFELAVERHNRTMRVISALLIATARLLRGEFTAARTWALRGLELGQAIGSRASVPSLGSVMILAHHAEGTPIDHTPYLDQIEEGVSSVAGVQQNLRFVVDAFLAVGDVERAERVAQTVRQRAGGRFRQAYSAKALGDVAVQRGASMWSRAAPCYEEAVRLSRKIGARSLLAVTLLSQARLLGLQEQPQAALGVLDEAMHIFRTLGMQWYLAQGEGLHERLVAGAGAPR